jgi:hypothetical protein
MAKGKSSRLDFVTLDTAHKQFVVLARAESGRISRARF